MTSIRSGLTQLEVLVAASVIIFVGAMVLLPSHSYGSGKFTLRIYYPGEEPSARSMRFALIRRKDTNVLLTHHPHPEVRWESVSANESMDRVVSFSVDSAHYLWGSRKTKVAMIADAVAVEYASSDEPLIFRVIPFERPSENRLAEVTIPREPPSDAEAWKRGNPAAPKQH